MKKIIDAWGGNRVLAEKLIPSLLKEIGISDFEIKSTLEENEVISLSVDADLLIMESSSNWRGTELLSRNKFPCKTLLLTSSEEDYQNFKNADHKLFLPSTPEVWTKTLSSLLKP